MLSFHLNDEFDPQHLAELFCREFKRNRTEGWGLSTLHAIARMVYNRISWDACAGPIGSASNGTAMRAGPFGLFPWKSEEEMIKLTILGAKITHRDPEACTGAGAIAKAHRYLIECQSFDRDVFCNTIIQAIGTYSKKVANFFDDVFSLNELFIILEQLSLIGKGPKNSKTGRLGISGYVLPSVAVSLSIFLYFPRDPCQALAQAMLAGGDTDTIESMVGGLIGTLNGASIWPDHLATNVQDYENLLVIADSFAKTCWFKLH